MKTLKSIILIILMAGLAACEKEILYEDIESEPLLVVNGIQRVGQPARLSVEKSSFYIESEKDFRVKDVHVDLYVNGVFKESLQVRDSIIMETFLIVDEDGYEHEEQQIQFAFNYCESEYILCEGDALRFEVSSSEFDEVAVAETTIPYTPNVVGFDTVRVEEMGDGYYAGYNKVFFALTLDDPAGKDYYNLYGKEAFQGYSGFYSSDPVFTDFMNIVHVDDLFGGSEYIGRGGYNIFNDSYFDENQYAVSLYTSVYTEDGQYTEPFVMEVSKVDYNLYQFKKSYSSYQYTDDGLLNLFTEPTQVYSNVLNGVGVVASQGLPVTVTIDLQEGSLK